MRRSNFVIAVFIAILGWSPSAHSSESCVGSPTTEDKAELHAMDEALAASDFSKSQIDAIVSEHETRLSPGGQVALLADLHQRSFDGFIEELQFNPELSQAYLSFEAEVTRYKNRRERILGGVRGVLEDDKKLDLAEKQFLNQIGAAELDDEMKKQLRLQVNRVMIDCDELASDRAEEAAHQFSVGIAVSGTVMAADLIVLSFATGGLTSEAAAGATAYAGSSLAGTITSAAMTAVTGVASGGGVIGLAELTGIYGHAAVNTDQESSYFCHLAQTVDKDGAAAFHEALVYAIFSGVAGGVLRTAIGFLPKTAAMTIGFSLNKVGQIYRSLLVLKAGSKTYELVKQAHQASEAGDQTKAKALIAQAKDSAVDAGMDAVATVFLFWLIPARAKFTAKMTGKPAQLMPSFKQLLNMGWTWMNTPVDHFTALNLSAS